MSFIQALFTHEFLQNAFIGSFLASIACGIIGPFVVVKRIGYISGGISHAVLGGLGMAYFFHFNPILGAMIFSIIAAIIIGIVSIKSKQHEDIIISSIWASGMAIGLIFISRTPGYNADLMSYLFGNVLMISKTNLLYTLILDIFILLSIFLFYKQFVGICFDEEFSQVRGLNTTIYYLFLLCIIALTSIVLIQIVGLILVIALLTIPAAISQQYFNSIKKMILFSCILGSLFTILGLGISYLTNFPSGASMILVAVLIFFISSFLIKKPKKS